MATRKVTPLVRTRGVKVCEFIEKFCLAPEGDLIGKPIKLGPFQRRFQLQPSTSRVTLASATSTLDAMVSFGRSDSAASIWPA